ncbi:hypothetical protein bcCo53_001268 (plasmid) [Borrelia coriaceae]|uniref:BTA121 domain-containing protein surface lipoprotein n=1 Tax=Borrelia coriaceae TaxID=144 RepID=UPI0012DBCD28|nr:hypothetical protein [Borrelia coriaceae]UPA17099.1 hypothetical protein bcCo53_001268 [Borrelia coriaceae]
MQVSYISSFLILPLCLIICCDVESKRDTSVGGNLVKKGIEKPVVSIPVVIPDGSVIHSSSQMDVSDDIDIDIDIKIDTLLSTFELSEQEIEAVQYIRLVLADESIGKKEGYATYDDDKFYTLLTDLGSNRLREIIAFHLKIINLKEDARAEVSKMLSGINEGLRQRVKKAFINYEKYYSVYLKSLFDAPRSKDVYNKFIKSSDSNFIGIKNEVIGIIEDGTLYAGKLSEKELDIVAYMRNVLTNPNILSGTVYKEYSKIEFYDLLRQLGHDKLKDIINVSLMTFQTRREALTAIMDIKREEAKKPLMKELYAYDNEYPSYLKGLFGGATLDDVYRNIMDSDYAKNFTDIRDEALAVKLGEDQYSAHLSSSELEVLDSIRLAVTGPLVDDKDKATYNYIKFYDFLSRLGVDKVREIVINAQKTFMAIDAAKVAIESVRFAKLQRDLKDGLSSELTSYSRALKEAFFKLTPNDVYRAVMSLDYSARFEKITSDASSIWK